MAQKEKRPLLSFNETHPSNFSDHRYQPLVRRVVMQLAAEAQQQRPVNLNRNHKHKLEHVRVFTDLSDFFWYCDENSGIPWKLREKLLLRLQAFFSLGFSTSIWHKDRQLWIPAVYLRQGLLIPQMVFGRNLLHELQHAVDEILYPLNEKGNKRYREMISNINLSLLIVVASVAGLVLLQQADVELPIVPLATSGLIGAFSTLSNLGVYHFNRRERRARATSKRVRK